MYISQTGCLCIFWHIDITCLSLYIHRPCLERNSLVRDPQSCMTKISGVIAITACRMSLCFRYKTWLLTMSHNVNLLMLYADVRQFLDQYEEKGISL